MVTVTSRFPVSRGVSGFEVSGITGYDRPAASSVGNRLDRQKMIEKNSD